MPTSTGFTAGIRREITRIGSRRIYLLCMIAVPVFVAVFFVSLLWEGLPVRIPTAIVDLDHSAMSREVTRTLGSSQLVDISTAAESYDSALEQIRRGEIYGFFVIPADFERDVLGGRTPTLEYYSNMTFFIPGTLSFKGFKTVAVMTSGGVVRTILAGTGLSSDLISGMLQPVSIDINPLNNPWMNYSIYLSPSFTMATLALMIMLVTCFSITGEIKYGTSREWLRICDNNILTALSSKLLPQTAIFSLVGIFILWIFFGVSGVPLNGSFLHMIIATVLFVAASQGLGLLISSILPNPRLAYSVCALFGVLSYSFTGFSFPVENMYGGIAIFSYLAPVRYWFLIYTNEALNGVDLYYSRLFFAALIAFPLIPALFMRRLKKALSNPVYVP